MTDYLDIRVRARLASNPELDPTIDTFEHDMQANRSGGYAKEGDRLIIAADDHIHLNFGAFELDEWVEVMFANIGPNPAVLTLTSEVIDHDIPLPVDGVVIWRHYNASTPGEAYGEPKVYSALGTTVEYLAVGEPYTTPA